MKYLPVFFLLLAVNLFAAETKPLLVKSFENGLVPAEYGIVTHCEVFPTHVLVTNYVGSRGLKTQRTFLHTLRGDILKLVNGAALGKIEDTPAPTDGPTTRWNAILETGKEVPLKADGSLIQKNTSKEAVTLINFLDLHCN